MEAPRRVIELSPQQAHQLVQDEPAAVMIDVRSSMEFLFVGHPIGAVHVAWIDEPDWTVDPHFSTQVRQVMLGGLSCDNEGCAPVILICRSGKRSREAGKRLIEDGFSQVYNISQGFEGELDEHHHRSSVGGWRHAGLPWEQC